VIIIALILFLVAMIGVIGEMIYEKGIPRKTVLLAAITGFLLLCAFPAFGQGARYDGNITTSANSVPPGAQSTLYTVPYAKVTVCGYPANGSPCTNPVLIYSDVSLSTPYLITQPIVADVHGKYGFWIAPGQYTYSVASSTGVGLGTFNLTIAGSGGGSATFPSNPGIVYSTNPSSARNGVLGDIVGLFTGPCTGTNVLQANGTCATIASGTTYLQAGSGVTITGSGTLGSPYIISAGSVTFNINSFTGGQSVEFGTAVVNPTFNATYSSSATSASITNTESISSPTNLTTPFTSGTVTGTFSHTTGATTTFTLTASNGTSTPTATQQIVWQPRIFGGVGTAGATSSVTASGTTAVLSNSSVLPTAQLGAESVGLSFGPYSPSGQAIYLLLTGAGHTFIDAGTGFPFAFNAPITVTFVNSQGVTITMYLYQSTNSLYGIYTPKVVS
jgi:hypothetical protein